jgi:hypothetical protein
VARSSASASRPDCQMHTPSERVLGAGGVCPAAQPFVDAIITFVINQLDKSQLLGNVTLPGQYGEGPMCGVDTEW